MPIIVPTPSLEKLKKFPTQAFIIVLSVLLGYFINSSKNSDKDNMEAWKVRALTSERKNDSLTQAFSNFRDVLIEKDQEVNFYKNGVTRVDSVKTVIKQKAKQIKK